MAWLTTEGERGSEAESLPHSGARSRNTAVLRHCA